MRLPDIVFPLLNRLLSALLRSPLHRVCSDSLMLITFRGRRTGKAFTTPVRYVRVGETVRCFTSAENQWWRNLRGGADVTLRIAGEERSYRAVAIADDPATVRQWLTYYLARFPQDAAYHDIRRRGDGSLEPQDLARAAHHAVVVEATPQAGD
jgi:deazaflavin-dependent oxidoreductase (nitroreductase family)